MCVTSMVGDHYAQKFGPLIKPWIQPYTPLPPGQYTSPAIPLPVIVVPKSDFDALRAEVDEMKALLKRAKLYDEVNNEPSCEQEEKMDLLRRVAAAVGIDLNDVIGPKAL